MLLLRRNIHTSGAVFFAIIAFFVGGTLRTEARGRPVTVLPPQTIATPQPALPESWNDAVHTMAKKIAATIPSIPASLTVKNNS